VLLWHPTWINEFFQPPYTSACPQCIFTQERDQIGEAKVILYSIPELGYGDLLEDPQLSRAGRGSAKLLYMCLEASEEYDCFQSLPPGPRDPGNGKHAELFDLFAGHQMCADVPALYPLPTREMMLRPVPPKPPQEPPISYFSSNCRGPRDQFVQELMQHMEVASYGDCLHNRGGDDAGGRTQGFEGTKAEAKMRRMGAHMFNIAHEGFSEPYYFSEKLWEPYQAGSVPIYFGAGKELELEGILPEHSWIDAQKYPSVQALAEYLQRLKGNQAEYNAYFAWKQKPLPANFDAASKLDWKHLACNICNAPGVHGN